MVRLREGEGIKHKRGQRQEIAYQLEEAKWNMYAEKWELAERYIQRARDIAISLRDKAKIDEALTLLQKCQNREKVEL